MSVLGDLRHASGGLRRTALLLVVGAWLGVTGATWAGAVGSFATTSRLADPERDSSPPARRFRAAQDAAHDGRAASRYQAAEFNRWMFAAAGRAQLVLAGLALALAAWPGGPGRGAVSALALAALLAAASATVLVPWISGLGRDLAFASNPPPASLASAVETMRGLHAAYAALDVTKVALLLVGSLLASTRSWPAAPPAERSGPRRARWPATNAGGSAPGSASDERDDRLR